MKNTYFSKKIIKNQRIINTYYLYVSVKNIKADRQLAILCFSIRKKTYVLPLGLPPFCEVLYLYPIFLPFI